jgi:hypothetical protein
MIDVEAMLRPPEGQVDTPEQAQMRACLINALSGHSDTDTVRIASDLISLLRDQLLAGAAYVRRQAAREAYTVLKNKTALAQASGQSVQTVARLLTESRST